jgi:hypothetical protein
VLGLHPTFDTKMNSFTLDLKTGDLQQAEGKIPLPSGKMVDVKWKKVGEKIQYEIKPEEPIELKVIKNNKVNILKVNKLSSFEL